MGNTREIYWLNNNNARWDGSSYGPVFGNAWDIYINSTMTSGHEQHNNDSIFFNKFELTNNGNFTVKEIEVFQIEWLLNNKKV